MRIELNDDALEFGEIARRAIGTAGGDSLIQHVEADPATIDDALAPVLAELGVLDLDVRGNADELEAGAAFCRSVGWWAAPGSIAERLARPADLPADALAVLNGPRPSARMHGSTLRWVGADLDGRRSALSARTLSTTARKAAFVADVDLTSLDHNGAADVPLALTLGSWELLGLLDRSLALTVAYVKERKQFDRPLSAFQSVQFQLTDAEVERAGFEALAKYTLWSVAGRRDEALIDALALRVAGLQAADVVFRVCHQLHGAIGFCDETTISWLSRASQPLRRLPCSLSGTRAELTRRMGRRGLTGLFSSVPGPPASE